MGRNVKVVYDIAYVMFLFGLFWLGSGSGGLSTVMHFGASKLFPWEGETALFLDKALCFVSSGEFCERLS